MLMIHCGGDSWDESIKKVDVVDCRLLANIWTLKLTIRCCNICKDLRIEIPAIYCRYL